MVALPWSRTYALVLRPGATLALSAASDSAAFRAGLAKDVVPGESRPAAPPVLVAGCRVVRSGARCGYGPPVTGPLLYPEGDSVAAAIAARLVALSDEPGLTARRAPRSAIDSLLTAGRPAAP